VQKDIPNSEQIRYWNEEAGARWLEQQAQLDRLIQPFGAAALVAAEIDDGQQILDVGCGCGTSTLALRQQTGESGSVTGVDISAVMLDNARARARSKGLTDILFEQADAQTHRFPAGHYDRIHSRFGVMFFDDPVAAFTNLTTALKPQGLLAFVCWDAPEENPWVFKPMQLVNQHLPPPEPPQPGAPGPFAFADPARVVSLLTAAGFQNIQQQRLQQPILLGQTATEATDFTVRVGPASTRFIGAPAEQVAAVTREIHQLMAAHQSEAGVAMMGTARVVTARNG